MKRFNITIIGILVYLASYAQLPQQWVQTFQAQGKAQDRIASITADAAGNVYIAGFAGNHHGSPDAFAMKRNAQGDTLWTYYYDGGGNYEDYATAIAIDNAGNAYITGYSEGSSPLAECFTAKILPSGSQAWVMRYSPGNNTKSYGNALAVDASGNVYVAGYTDPYPGSNDWLVIKYNASGVQQWIDIHNGPGNGDDEAMDIVIAPNGNPTVCGYTYSVNASGNINAFVKQYTPANVTAWTDTWTNPQFTGADKAFGLGYSSSGYLYVGGETKNSTGSNRDAFALCYNTGGTRQWATIYTDANTSVDEYLRKVTIAGNGDVYFAGTDYQDAYVTCIRSDGTPGFRTEWAGPFNGLDVFHGITTDDNGNAYATGRGIYSGQGFSNMIIVKYDSAGNSIWTYRSMDSLNYSMGFSVAYRDGKIYAGGYTTDTAWVNENLYTLIADTSGAGLSEWNFNGRGDAVTTGQFVQTDSSYNIFIGATVDRLYGEGTDVVLVKYDSFGNLLWEKYYSSGGFRNDTLTAMQLDAAGNVVLCLATDENKLNINYRLSLLKVDPQGSFLDTCWYYGNGSVIASSMKVRPDGSVAISANSSSDGGIVLYFDPTFNPVWASKVDSTQFSSTKANSIDLLLNGDVVVGGFSQVSGVNAAIVQRYSSQGIKLWSTTIDSMGVFDEARSVTVNNADEVAYTGKAGNTCIVGKLHGNTGIHFWRRVYNPTTTSEYGVKVSFTPAGDIAFICRGWTGSVSRYFTVQYSNTGVFEWASTYSQTASDREPVDIIIEPDNRVVTAGWAINGTTANHDYVLAGYNTNGTSAFTNTYTTPTAGVFSWDELTDMTRDSLGNFILTGKTASQFYNTYLFKTLTIKYGSAVVGEEEIPQSTVNMATVYPNPSTDGRFTLLDASPYPITKGSVFDLQGRLITDMKVNSLKVDLSSFKKGIYILLIVRTDGTTEPLKLVNK